MPSIQNLSSDTLSIKKSLPLKVQHAAWWAPYLTHLTVDPHNGQLLFSGKSVQDLAKEHGTPLFLYSGEAVRQRIRKVEAEFAKQHLPFDLCYALKACKVPEILDIVKQENTMVDAVSPYEVQVALNTGFLPSEISVTGAMHSNKELKYFAETKVHMNLDGFSQIRRYAQLVPKGTHVGLRIDPGRYIKGCIDHLTYTQTKFGVSLEEMPKAIQMCQELGLVVTCFHTHLSWSIQDDGAEALEATFNEVAKLSELLPPGQLKVVDVGGGLGARFKEGHHPLSVENWVSIISRCFGHLHVRIVAELGSYVMAESAVLVSEVTTVQEKMGSTWMGLDAGFHVNAFPMMIGITQDLVHVTRPLQPHTRKYHIGGNINAPIDVFGFDVPFGEVQEEEYVVFLSSGAYILEQATHFCGRGPYSVVVL